MGRKQRDEPIGSHIADATGSGGADDQKAQINAILVILENAGFVRSS